jgi:hypothetical protein
MIFISAANSSRKSIKLLNLRRKALYLLLPVRELLGHA